MTDGTAWWGAVKPLLLQGSDRQFDPIAKVDVQKWDEPWPTSAQVLHTLDMCVAGSLCPGVAIQLMDRLWRRCCQHEGITTDQSEQTATWRQEMT